MQEAQQDALSNWLEGLRSEAKIELRDAELRALVKIQEEDYDEAVLEYKSAIALDPENAYLHVGLPRLT